MEDRDRTRRKSRRARTRLHGAPRRCALGTPALRPQPVGWGAQPARAAHPYCPCQVSLTS